MAETWDGKSAENQRSYSKKSLTKNEELATTL